MAAALAVLEVEVAAAAAVFVARGSIFYEFVVGLKTRLMKLVLEGKRKEKDFLEFPNYIEEFQMFFFFLLALPSFYFSVQVAEEPFLPQRKGLSYACVWTSPFLMQIQQQFLGWDYEILTLLLFFGRPLI